MEASAGRISLALVALLALAHVCGGCEGSAIDCPSAPCVPADAATDSPRAACGNGTIDPGEVCDPPASCPASCDDGNACTLDPSSGSADACNRACMHVPATRCGDDDGCCPSGCDATTDPDCSLSCGNGALEPGETCDPPASCPTSCDDGNACTRDGTTGDARTCNLACTREPLAVCDPGDGCCPTGCDATSDSDCSASCGNETLEPGETCDPPASCPTSCDDGNACTVDGTTGAASTCSVACTHTPTVSCSDADGCCPTGCNATVDSDCSPTCGNGTLEPGETCDPPASCPSSCDDGNACTIDGSTGSAGACNLVCTHTSIVTCRGGDGCCPAGCDAARDTDCSSTCGNGVVEPGESCDPPASCPASCDDANTCTLDGSTGSAASCNLACTHAAVTACRAGDGCCPASCNATLDSDCPARCGNAVIEPGETCDPPATCPASCDDANTCTADASTGAASTCNVTCSHTAITMCAAGDACCPPGCDASSDADCAIGPCTDDCALGQSRCAPTGWQVCGAYDADTCLDWSPAMACPIGSACTAGVCRLTCANECPLAGVRRCATGGSPSIEECGDPDGDRCLEWAGVMTCAATCSLAACGASACTNACNSAGAVRCDPAGSATGRQVCQDGNADGCLEWIATTPCSAGTTCSSGSCSATVRNECAASDRRCDPATGGAQTCTTTPSGQRRWSTPTSCAAGDVCTWGACRAGCSDECIAGERRCATARDYERCDQSDSDGCLEWPASARVSCGSGESCAGGGLCIANGAAGFHPMPFFRNGEAIPYDVYRPASYAGGTAPVGTMIAMHGSCEAGEREVFSGGQWNVHAESLGILVLGVDGPRHFSTTAGLLAPLASARCWQISPRADLDDQAAYVLEVLADARARERIDASRVRAFGFSGGAYVACHLAMFHAGNVFGAGMHSSECNYRNTDPAYIAMRVPFYFLAGDADSLYASLIVPEYDYLRLNGYRTTLVTVAGGVHTYFPSELPAMWTWLVAP